MQCIFYQSCCILISVYAEGYYHHSSPRISLCNCVLFCEGTNFVASNWECLSLTKGHLSNMDRITGKKGCPNYWDSKAGTGVFGWVSVL